MVKGLQSVAFHSDKIYRASYLFLFLFLLFVADVTGQTYRLGPQLEPLNFKSQSQQPVQPSYTPLVLESNCENSNFSLGTWKGWNGCYGTFNKTGSPPKPVLSPCEQPGYSPTRHVLKQGPGYFDHYSCGGLPTVFPGESWCARLGDTASGGHAEQLKYEITVDDETYLFVYRYAVVLESPNHTMDEQPGFKVEIQDMMGNVIDSTCGLYEVYAPNCWCGDPGCEVPPGWVCCGSPRQVYWKDWTTVGMNLTSYVGQTIRIVFTTHGCCYSAHMGYAYLSAYCSYLTMQTAMCQGDTSATLSAPPGFSYLWHTVNGDTAVNGDTTSSIVVPNPTTGSTYTCVLTAVNGCSVTISQTLTYTVITANFTHGSSCATLPIVFDDSSYVNQNEVTGWRWDFGDGSPVVTGNPTPTHSFANPGVYNVQLIANSTEGCKDTIVKTISVDSLPTVTNTPLVKSICSKENTDIDITASVTGTLVTWTASSKNGTTTGFFNSTAASSSIDQVLNNTGTIPDTITYHITPYKNTCSGPPVDYKVAVMPFPLLTNIVRLKSICDSTATNISLTTNNDSTQFTWSCTTSSANLSGYSNSATPGRIINQTIDNTGFTIDTVYYHIVGHSYGCSGDTSIYKVAVYPSPNLSNLPASKSICTNTSTNVNLTSNVVGTLFTWTATGSSANVSGYSNNATPTTLINQVLVNTDINLETVTYHVTPVANGCSGKVTNYTVTVNPLPLLTNIPPFTAICSNVLSNITLYSTVAGTQFTWTCTPSSGNVTGYSNNSTPTTTIAQTFQNSGNVLEIVTYHVTPQANGCPGTLQDYEVRVQPVPQLTNSPAVKSICEGENTAVTLTSNVSGALFTWTCTPGSASVSGYSNNATPGTSISQVLTNSGTAPETVTYHLTPSANFCTGPVADFVVTVTPKPTMTVSPLSQAFCSGGNPNLLLTADCPGSTFAWTAQLISGTASGFADGNGNTISQVLTNSGTTNGIVKYTITPTLGVCVGTSADYLVTVYPVPDLSTTPLSQTLCSSTPTNINLTSNVTGTLFTWTASGSSLQVAGYSNSAVPMTTINHLLVNSGYNIESVTYSITPHANGCNGSVYSFVSTVNPVPDITTSPSMYTICNNTSPNLALTSNVAGTLFTWTAFSTAGTLTGFSNNLTPTNILNQTLNNSGYTIEWVGYQITPSANGCNGTPLLYAITVNPTPDLSNLPLSQSQCNNQSTNLTLTSHVSGTQFAWITTGSSPQVAGYSNNVTTPDTEIDQTLVNSGYNIETVTYHLLPEANGCDGTVTNYVVTVYPVPDLSNTPLASQLCSGSSPMINLTSNVAGTNFNWTATGSSPNIVGYGPGSGTLINQVLTNLGLSIESVTYQITPSANGCTGIMKDFVVTTVSTPNVYFTPPAQTICNAQTSNIQVLSQVSSATFTWTASASSTQLSGYSNGAGNLIAQTVFNSGNTIETVTYTATPTAFGCPPGIPQSVVLTVNPKPAVTNATRSSAICSAGTTNITLQSSVVGSTYNWTASGSTAQVSGFANGTGSLIAQTLTNTGWNIETVTYIVTPSANSCSGDTSHFRVTVYPVADAYYTPPTQALCPGQTTNVVIASHVTGATFTWTATGSTAQVSGYASGSGNTVQQTLLNSGYSIETVTYRVTPVANGCTGTASNLLVSVNPNPMVTFVPCWDPTLTTTSKPISLKGATPLGGTFTGPGVTSGIFYPALAGTGTHTISYGSVNSYGCSSVSTQTITVVSPLAFSCGNALVDVRDNKSYPTVQIDGQCWMAANLDYGTLVSGALTQRDNCLQEKFCYNDNAANCTTMGGLYQWDELMQYTAASSAQGLCPPDWHIPTEAEWNTLFNYFISNGFAGSALKVTGYSGFNAFLDGARFKNVNWNFLDFATLFWSSTQKGALKAWAHGMNTYNPSVSFYPAGRYNAFSVRCTKD
jgi:uncharacterized protein (TIGR02145 family)